MRATIATPTSRRSRRATQCSPCGAQARCGCPSLGTARFPLVLFTQELLALLRSGISLVEALETLAEKESRASTGPVLGRLLEQLREGQSFSSGLQGFPDAFPDLYVATVRASERTGNLAEALSRFVTYQTQLDGVKKHLVSASIYPVILIAVGGLVSLFLLGYVVPRFSHIYEDIGGDLPWLTRVLMAWGTFVEARGGMLLAAIVAALSGLVLWLRQPSARQLISRQIMRIPASRRACARLSAHALLSHDGNAADRAARR